MSKQIVIGDVTIDVTLKDIKNIHLSVHPPTGKVRISAPLWMDMDTIRVYAISKVGWIRARMEKFQGQERETPREYLERESHYLWGRRYLLEIIEGEGFPSVEIKHSKLVLRVRKGTDQARKKAIMDEWYRHQIRQALPELVAKWEGLMGVKVTRIFVRWMKTRWGSCNPKTGNVFLNTELAKKPPECLEYILVHEMAHLIVPTHNERYVLQMDRFLPHWKQLRDELNRQPLGHATWDY